MTGFVFFFLLLGVVSRSSKRDISLGKRDISLGKRNIYLLTPEARKYNCQFTGKLSNNFKHFSSSTSLRTGRPSSSDSEREFDRDGKEAIANSNEMMDDLSDLDKTIEGDSEAKTRLNDKYSHYLHEGRKDPFFWEPCCEEIMLIIQRIITTWDLRIQFCIDIS
jgi:hypothetical protein